MLPLDRDQQLYILERAQSNKCESIIVMLCPAPAAALLWPTCARFEYYSLSPKFRDKKAIAGAGFRRLLPHLGNFMAFPS